MGLTGFSGPIIDDQLLCNHPCRSSVNQPMNFCRVSVDDRLLCNHFCQLGINRSMGFSGLVSFSGLNRL